VSDKVASGRVVNGRVVDRRLLTGLRSQPGIAPRLVAVAAGMALDAAFGEPPRQVHPVVGFGAAMTGLERRIYADNRLRGAMYASSGMLLATGVGLLGANLSKAAPAVAVTAATCTSVASRALWEAAGEVGAHLDRGRIDEARAAVASLVGRTTSGLEPGEVARAAVESVAENTVDAIVAPVFWAAAAGAPGVLCYRAVNTLDAMVGHRNDRYERFGWASARLDDAAAWVPSRLTALLVAATRPSRAADVWRAVRRQAPAHPSPNAGVAEAAFAAALGVRLGGVNSYGGRTERRPILGRGKPVDAADIGRACRLSRDVTVALGLLVATVAFSCGRPRPVGRS
jgi:adenosylcobinamide-phosphate synthase